MKAKRYKPTFTMPETGEPTTNVKKYLSAWADIHAPLLKIPGVMIHSFDPTTTILFENACVHNLPTRFIRALATTQKATRNAIVWVEK